ncbi:MAG TPA: GNAT family N-acetyltransferase [Methyloceanibacter sp.]
MSVVSSTVAIRPALAPDLEAVGAIHAASFAKAWSANEIGQFVAAPGCLSLIVSTAPEQTVQGFLIVRSAGDEAEILTLAVDPSHRCKGLGRALLAAAIASLREAGAKRLFLEVDEANAPARGLYQSLGAVAVGRRKRYYEHGADADIFSLAL